MAEKESARRSGGRDDPATVAARIAALLRDDIIHGALAPGQRLNEVALAKGYGVSRIPLREALRILEGQGLVEIRAFGGASVSELSAEEAVDILEVFEALEGLALRHAVPSLTPGDLKLAEHLARKAEREPDPRRWLEHIREFYATIYGGVGRRHLMDMLQRVALNHSRYLYAFVAASRAHGPALPGPRDLVKVLRTRDVEAALAFQRDWRGAQRAFLVERLARLAEPAADGPTRPQRRSGRRTAE